MSCSSIGLYLCSSGDAGRIGGSDGDVDGDSINLGSAKTAIATFAEGDA